MRKIIALFLAALTLLALGGCGGETEQTTASAEPAEAEVRLLNTDADLDAQWRALAAAYTAETGIPVRVETAAELPEDLTGSDAPTLVTCGSAAWLEKVEDQLLDLSGTAVYGRMTTEKYNWTDSAGRVKAMAYRREAYGLLVNEELLAQAGYSLEMLMDYGMLAMIASDIHSRSEKLGFDAFAPMAEAEAEELAAALVNAALYYEFRDGGVTEAPASMSGSYLPGARNFLELLTGGISDGDTARAAFDRGEAVFLPASTVGAAETVLPLFCGIEDEEDGGLWEIHLSRWAVNAAAPQVCVDATLDFLNWVVTGEAGTAMLAGIQCRQLFEGVPAPEAETVTVDQVSGRIGVSMDRLESAAEAITGCLAGENDWDAVENAFVS